MIEVKGSQRADFITEVVLNYYDKTYAQITTSREGNNPKVLHVIWHLLHKHLGLSHGEIGSKFNRDRSTVSSALTHTINEFSKPGITDDIAELTKRISNPGKEYIKIKLEELKKEVANLLDTINEIEQKELSNKE